MHAQLFKTTLLVSYHLCNHNALQATLSPNVLIQSLCHSHMMRSQHFSFCLFFCYMSICSCCYPQLEVSETFNKLLDDNTFCIYGLMYINTAGNEERRWEKLCIEFQMHQMLQLLVLQTFTIIKI